MQMDQAKLAPVIAQDTWCYSVHELGRIFSEFSIQHYHPIGIAIPPSYLESKVKRAALILPLISVFESLLGKLSMLSDYADHLIIIAKKNNPLIQC